MRATWVALAAGSRWFALLFGPRTASAQALILDSNPGASHTLYLNFTGYARKAFCQTTRGCWPRSGI